MAYIVTGGHSPIALAITKKLCNKYKVYHITRKIDDFLKTETSDFTNIVLEEWDLENTTSCITKLKNKLENEVIDGIVFSHRYREGQKNFSAQFTVEVKTPFDLINLYCSHNRFQEASIVFITSPAASSIVQEQDFAYHACKAALSQLVKFAAINLSNGKKRFNGVSPGGFFMKERSRIFYEQNKELLDSINNFVPLGRMGTVDEVASVVEFLCSCAASFINGEIITVDGGYSGMEPSFALLDKGPKQN